MTTLALPYKVNSRRIRFGLSLIKFNIHLISSVGCCWHFGAQLSAKSLVPRLGRFVHSLRPPRVCHSSGNRHDLIALSCVFHWLTQSLAVCLAFRSKNQTLYLATFVIMEVIQQTQLPVLEQMKMIHREWIKTDRTISVLAISFPDICFENMLQVQRCCLRNLVYVSTYESLLEFLSQTQQQRNNQLVSKLRSVYDPDSTSFAFMYRGYPVCSSCFSLLHGISTRTLHRRCLDSLQCAIWEHSRTSCPRSLLQKSNHLLGWFKNVFEELSDKAPDEDLQFLPPGTKKSCT